MIEINFMQNTQMGTLKGILRVIGRDLFFKYNDSSYANQAIEQMKNKGVFVEFGKGKEWIRVDLFSNNSFVKLGDETIDVDEEDPIEVENKLAKFYIEQYKKANFLVEVKE